MEITVAYVANNGCQHTCFINILSGFHDAFRQPRDRDANIGGVNRRTGTKGLTGKISVMACLPKLVALFRMRGPLEIGGTEFASDPLYRFRLFLDTRFGAMKFEKQGWLNRVI